MSGTYDPLHVYTPDDHGAPVAVTVYFLLGTTAVVTAARIYVSYRAKHPFRWDDAFFYVAVVIAMVQSVLIDQAVENGLGRHIDTLSGRQSVSFYKFVYSASILGIFAMLFAKMSVITLYERISQDQHKLGAGILKGIIIAWAVFSVFAQAFQCGIPHPWVTDPATCDTKGRLNYPIIILNAVTDALLAVGLAKAVLDISNRMNNRTLICSLFLCRIVVSAAAIVQMVFTAGAIDEPDQSWAMNIPMLLLCLTTHVSVIVATVPRVHSFIADLRTNSLRNTSYDKEANNMSRSDQQHIANPSEPSPPAVPHKAAKSQSSRTSRLTWPRRKKKTGLTVNSTTQGSYYQPPVYVARVATLARPERGGARDSLEAIIPEQGPAHASSSNSAPYSNQGPSNT